MLSWGTVALVVTLSMTNGAVAVRRVIETTDAVYFEPTATHPQNVVWVYPKTKTVVTRSAQDPAYLQAELVLRDVQLPADLSTLEPGWKGKQALFYQVTAQSECVLKSRPEMKFVQQWVMQKGVTIQGSQRSAICSFTFKLRPETPALIQQLEEEAEAGTLIAHELKLQLSITSIEPLRWTALHAGLVREGVEVGSPRSPELAAFELGGLSELSALQSQSPTVQQSFLEAALRNLFGWDGASSKVRLSSTALAGQYELPGVPNVISL